MKIYNLHVVVKADGYPGHLDSCDANQGILSDNYNPTITIYIRQHRKRFFEKYLKDISPCGTPIFGLLVTSALGFKVTVGSLICP